MAVSRRGLFKLARPVDYDGAAERVRAAWAREGHEPLLRELEPIAARLVAHAELQEVDGRYVLIRGVRRPTRPARPTS